MKKLLLIAVLFCIGCHKEYTPEQIKLNQDREITRLKSMLPTTAVIVSERGEGGGWYMVEYNSGMYLARIEPTYGANNLSLVPYTGR